MPAARTRLVLALSCSLFISLTAFAAQPVAQCAAANAIRVDLADAAATVGGTGTVAATVHAASSMPVRIWFVLPPHATVQAGQPIFEGTIGPNAPAELRAVISPLRAGTSPIAIRVESLRDGCRWIAGSATLNVAAAEQRPAPARTPRTMAAGPKRAKAKDGSTKVSSQLKQAMRAYAAKGNRGAASLHGVNIEATGEARVRVRFAEGTNVEELRGRFRASHKAEIEKSRGTSARVRIPLAAIQGLAEAYPEIVQIYMPAPPQPLAVTGEGVAGTGANTRHSAGYNGTGAKVMVIDLGFQGLAAAQASGDLPASGMTLLDCVGGCAVTTFPTEDENHGTAVAEIVHEMAPGATLYLVKIGDELDLADAVDYAGAAGIDIITHSVGWVNYNFYDGQCFYNGPTCATDDAILDHNILWVNSAGNNARRHYDGFFTDVNGNWDHDTAITIPNVVAGQWIVLFATWDAWPVTSNDFDLYLVDPNGEEAGFSENWQVGDAASQPTESIGVIAPVSGTYTVYFTEWDALPGTRFKIHSFTSNFGNGVIPWSITGPSDGQFVVSVAAVRASQYTSAAGLESYSSRGPTTDGVIAPTISAPTVVSNTTSNGFNGTSAAAPHVAGAAAVLLSQHPTWGWVDLFVELTSTAVDMGAANPDTEFGYGRLSLCTAPNAPTLNVPSNGTAGQAYQLTWNSTVSGNTYELEEADNPNFSNSFVMNPVGTTFQVTRNPNAVTTYYYRIRGKLTCNGTTVYGPWSNVDSIVVDVPNACLMTNISQPAGEDWVAGGQVLVRWTMQGGCGSNVVLDLFTQQGAFHSSIAGGPVANSGVYLWTIPANLTPGTYQVRVFELGTGIIAFKTVTIQGVPNHVPGARADFNGDSRRDLVWRNKDTGHVWVTLLNNTAVSGGFLLHWDSNLDWRIVGTADFNGDGHGDVLYRNFVTGQLYIQLFTGATLIGSGVPWADNNPLWNVVDLADVDGDKRTDIIWRNSSTGQIFILLMSGTQAKAWGTVWTEPNLDWQIISATDMDNDGKADLVWRNSTNGLVFAVYLNGLLVKSSGVFSENRGTAWSLASIGDVDADGDGDLVYRHNTNGQVWISFTSGLNSAGSAQVWTEPNADWHIHAMADFDLNGRADMLWRNSANGILYLVTLNGSAVAGSGVLYNEPNLAWKLVAPTQPAWATGGNVSP